MNNIMKKIGLFIILILSTQTGLAKSKKDATAELSKLIPVYRAKQLIEYNRCQSSMTDFLAATEKAILEPGFSSFVSGDIQYACRKVVVEASLGEHNVYTSVSDYWIMLTVSCEPRTTSEKQLFSYARRCEESPTPECFKPEMRTLMDQLMPTVFEYKEMVICGRLEAHY